jgi:hypothetical protein
MTKQASGRADDVHQEGLSATSAKDGAVAASDLCPAFY